MRNKNIYYLGKDGGAYNTPWEQKAADTRYDQMERLIKSMNNNENTSQEENNIISTILINAFYVFDENNEINSSLDIFEAYIIRFLLWIITCLIICFIFYMFTPLLDIHTSNLSHILFKGGTIAGSILGTIGNIALSKQKNVVEYYKK